MRKFGALDRLREGSRDCVRRASDRAGAHRVKDDLGRGDDAVAVFRLRVRLDDENAVPRLHHGFIDGNRSAVEIDVRERDRAGFAPTHGAVRGKENCLARVFVRCSVTQGGYLGRCGHVRRLADARGKSQRRGE